MPVFFEAAVCVKTQIKRAGILKDIIQESCQNVSTIVVGRREVISFTQEHFRGRSSEKIIKSLNNMAVWVVS